MLKNRSRRYSSHYIIKLVDFTPIYYVINQYIVLSFMVFKNLYIGSIDLVESIKLIFLSNLFFLPFLARKEKRKNIKNIENCIQFKKKMNVLFSILGIIIIIIIDGGDNFNFS